MADCMDKDLMENEKDLKVETPSEPIKEHSKGKERKADRRSLGRLTLFMAFLAPCMMMFALFVGNRIYPFGNRTFICSDMLHQYVPFLQEFVRMIKRGDGLDYSWYVGLGSNFLSLYVYYLASPLNWLVFLFPEKLIIEFMSYIVIIKIGLAGLTSCIYLRSRASEKRDPRLVLYGSFIVSIFYAMSAFIAAYNFHVMWMDCIVLFPLIMMALERLVKKGKMGLYVITLGLCIITNFYLSIMICMSLVLYFIYLFLTEKKSFSMIWKFALGSLLAGGLAGALLVPQVRALMTTHFGDMDFPKKWDTYFSVLDVLARHCAIIKTERELEHWPNIYCGVMVLLMVPLYAVNEKIPAKKRFCSFALAGLFLASFCTNILDFIWHGFNFPDSLPARQSFVYILIILVMCYECFMHLDGLNKGMVLKAYLGAVAFLLFVEKCVDVDDFHYWTIYCNIAILTIYAVCLYVFLAKKGKVRYVVACLAIVTALGEAAGNMGYSSVATTDRSRPFNVLMGYEDLYERNQASKEGFLRAEKLMPYTKNDGVWGGYPSASVFSSTMNSRVMDFYVKLGLQHSKVYYSYGGATPITSALLSVGYHIADSDQLEDELHHLVDEENGHYLYELNYAVPFGFVAPADFELPDGINDKGVILQNKLARALGAYDAMLVKKDSTVDGDDVLFTVPQDGIYYGYVTNSGTKKIKMTGDGMDTVNYKDLKSGVLFYLGSLKEDQTVRFSNDDSDDKTPKISMSVYKLDMNAVEIAIDTMRKQTMTDVQIESKKVTGKVTLEEAGRLILSIPVDEGWKAWINGAETKTGSFGNALIAIDLEPGTYDVRLEYEPVGKKLGLAVSAVTLFITVLIFGLPAILRRKGKEREANS